MKPISLCALVLAFVAFVYAGPLLRGQEAGQPAAGTPVTNVPGTIQPAAPGAPTQPAVAVTTVPSPASPQNPTDQVMWALAMSYALRFLTKKGWLSFLTPASTARVKAVAGFLVAAATAAGIHFIVNGSPFDGAGASITITGLSLDAIKDVGFQWVSQQGWYDLVVKRTA
jgi:hypothetical protein